ncbi:hypothetical protein WICPIJ_003924 [Wickerhamomyces pijperi]|uniref:Reverse transcriptase Ty1/copia-type domain-containing protein n=1 Tax=Wickerhamomyces pijperi TaxID=599730 RepID=A0A9P8Q8Z7_WICPI|nr:hypothetical protein WICPIJ_003924 [Wickerhamomyces pijperi]
MVVNFKKFSTLYTQTHSDSISTLQTGAPFFLKLASRDISHLITTRDEYYRALDALRVSAPKVKFSELKYWPLFELWVLSTLQGLLSTELTEDVIFKLLRCGDADNECSSSRFALLFAEGLKLYFKKSIYEDKRTQGLKLFSDINKQYLLSVENFREIFINEFFKGFNSKSIEDLIVDLKLMSLYSPKLESVFRNIVLISFPREFANTIYLKYNYANEEADDSRTIWDDIYDQESLKLLLKELSNGGLGEDPAIIPSTMGKTASSASSSASAATSTTSSKQPASDSNNNNNNKKANKIPKTYQDIAHTADPEKWRASCISEIKAIQNDEIFAVYRREQIKDENKIVQGYWKFEMDKNRETASLLIRENYESLDLASNVSNSQKSQRYLLSVAVQESLELRKFKFPNGKVEAKLDHCIYMKPPAGCGNTKDDLWRCGSRLSKFKTAQFLFYLTLSKILAKLGFVASTSENCLLVNEQKNMFIVLCDFEAIIAAPNPSNFQHVLDTLTSAHVTVTDCGFPDTFQHIDIRRRPNGDVEINTLSFIESLRKEYHITPPPNRLDSALPPEFNISDETTRLLGKAESTKYRKLLLDLKEISRCVRLDCYYEINSLYAYQMKPRDMHLQAATRIFNYLYSTRTESLRFSIDRRIKINLEEVPYEEADVLTKVNPLVVKYQLKAVSHSNDRLRDLQRVGAVTFFGSNIIDWEHVKPGTPGAAMAVREKKDLATHLKNLFRSAK